MYEYEEIIVNPYDKKVAELIGKEVYFHYKAPELVECANNDDKYYKGKLLDSNNDGFVIENENCEYQMIIPIKNPEVGNIEEFMDAYEKYTDFEKYPFCRYGLWLREKDSGIAKSIVSFSENLLKIEENGYLDWCCILNDFEFFKED